MDTENTEVVENTDAGQQESLLSGTEQVELGEGEWLLYDGVKGEGEKPEYYNDTKFKTLAEQAKGQSELHKMLGAFTGAPKDGYELPEGVEAEDELFKQLSEFATESNMSQDGMAKAWELLSAQNAASAEIDQEAEIAKLGDNASDRINKLDTALKNNLGEKYNDIAPLVTTADDIILAETLLKSLAPTKLPIDGGEHSAGMVYADIEKEMFKKDANGRLLRSTDANHNAKVERMLKEWGGDKEHKLVIG